MEACEARVAAVQECKRKLGLLPQQCYPQAGYKGECDAAEFEWKKCVAYVASARDAATLYDDKRAPRAARVAANARLQKAMRKYNQPCSP